MPVPASRMPFGVLIVSLTGRRTSALSSLPPPSVSALVLPCTAVPAIAGSVLTLIVGPLPPIASTTGTPLRRNSELRSATACLHAAVQCDPMLPSLTFTVAMTTPEPTEYGEPIPRGRSGQCVASPGRAAAEERAPIRRSIPRPPRADQRFWWRLSTAWLIAFANFSASSACPGACQRLRTARRYALRKVSHPVFLLKSNPL